MACFVSFFLLRTVSQAAVAKEIVSKEILFFIIISKNKTLKC